MKFQTRHKNRGTAVITAMLIVAMVVITTASILLRLHIVTVNTHLLLNSEQAYLSAVSAEEWAISQLAVLYVDPKNNDDFIKWPRRLGPIKYDGSTLQAMLLDAQSKININNIGNDDQEYSVLFKSLAKTIITGNVMGDLLQGWVDDLKNFIYGTPNQHLISPSELRVMPTMTPNKSMLLENNVFSLPEAVPININTATADTILMLHPDMTPKIVTDIIKAREEASGFRSVDNLKNIPSLSKIELNTNYLTVKSQYFLLMARVDVEQQHLILFSLLKLARSDQENPDPQAQNTPSKVSVIWHSIDTL